MTCNKYNFFTYRKFSLHKVNLLLTKFYRKKDENNGYIWLKRQVTMNETAIKTVVQLKNWMTDNCYPSHSYSINGNHIYEGLGLRNTGTVYQWYYTERGKKEILKEFNSEEDAVSYALKQIKADTHANRNLIGIFTSDKEVEEVLAILKKREVEYWTDEIPYGGLNDIRTRVFVVGCGIKKVQDLIEK